MADLIGNPNIAAGVQVPNQMTLGDMVNMARGIQAYKQAEQINPLAVQKATEEAQQAQIGTKQKQLELDQSHFSLAGNILSGLEARAQSLAQNKDYSTAMKELDIAERWMNTSGLPSKADGPMAIARKQLQTNDFNGYLATLENMRNTLAGASSRYQANLPQTATVGGAPATFTPASGVAKPMQIGGQAPQQPPVVGAPQAAGQQGVTPMQMRLPYPIRAAGDIRPYAPTEQEDQAAGQEYRNSLVSRQSTLATDRRNVEETIGQAEKIAGQLTFKSGGFLGDVERRIRTAVASEDYKMLAKDLANLQMSNLRTLGQGGNTVAGMDLTRVASGDETVPPETLIKIARRAQADMTNIDMQANGAEQFKNRFGDNNMNAFKQLWNANADSKIFEAMNIIRDVESPEERQKRLKELFPTQSKHQEFLTKYRNIKKLSETGSL